MEDKEINALAIMNGALKGLAEDERFRVMQFLYNKYPPANERAAAPSDSAEPLQLSDINCNPNTNEAATFSTFAELLDVSNARTEADKFLTAAYWITKKDGQESFSSFEANQLLKDTGNQLKKVSNPIRSLKEAEPACIVQITRNKSKTGKGRIYFKITSHGIKRIEGLLNGSAE